jgi:polysaccharide export outer membrane protein
MAQTCSRTWPQLVLLGMSVTCLLGLGCRAGPDGPEPGLAGIPTELAKVSHPDYTIAPPDVLLIDAVTLIPRPPYRIAPLDGLLIRATRPVEKEGKEDGGALIPGQPIDGLYRVEADGTVNLGFTYGSVQLRGLTIPEARTAIKAYLEKRVKGAFDVMVALAESRALQQIRGEHLVRQDGKVTLGTYGSVYVAGLTTSEAKDVIEQHLSRYLLDPEISLDVAGYNSKVYYVIFDQDGFGEQVIRLPITGNETVLDAIGELKGLPPGTDRRRIWVARPSPADHNCSQLLPVDWQAITKGGMTATNYQLLPGDRVYVSMDRWIAADSYLAKVFAPIERVLGITLLGSSVVHSIGTPLGFGTVVGGVGVVR